MTFPDTDSIPLSITEMRGAADTSKCQNLAVHATVLPREELWPPSCCGKQVFQRLGFQHISPAAKLTYYLQRIPLCGSLCPPLQLAPPAAAYAPSCSLHPHCNLHPPLQCTPSAAVSAAAATSFSLHCTSERQLK